MNLRHSIIDGEPTIPKTIIPSDFVGMNFGFTPEFTTLEQLEQLEELEELEQSEQLERLEDLEQPFQLFTQAILVGQRVLNDVSPGPHQHQFTLTFLCHCAAVYFYREEQRDYAINILMFLLRELQEIHLQDVRNNKIIFWALSIITHAIDGSPSIDNITSREKFANLMATFDFSTRYMSVLQENRHQYMKENPNCLENLARYILDMILSLKKMMPRLNPEECHRFENSLSLFIRKDHRWGIANRNLLHTICDYSNDVEVRRRGDLDVDGSSDASSSWEESDEDFELIRDYDEVNTEGDEDDNDDKSSLRDLLFSVTQLILRLGADPNAADLFGCTPLHLLAMNRGSVAQCRLLLDYGAHVHQTDSMNRTPLTHFQEWQRQLDNQGNPDLNLQFMIDSVHLPLPLSCLAAQVVSKHQIFPFDKEQVPSLLHPFTQWN
jgi:hypothetical protein